MPLPTETPTHELIIPESGTGLTSLEFTGGITLTSTWGAVDVGSDARGRYLSPTSSESSGWARFEGPDDTVRDGITIAAELVAELHKGGTGNTDTGAYFRSGITLLSMRRNYNLVLGHHYRYNYVGNGIDISSLGDSDDTGYLRMASIDRHNTFEVRREDVHDGPGDDIATNFVKGYAPGQSLPWPLEAAAPHYIQLAASTDGSTAKLYAARLWITRTADLVGKGLWSTRQRQTPAGNVGGWPLRQRQNGGATGTWPLRQRQNGI